MIDFKKLQFKDESVYKKRGKKNPPTSDTIYTYDIEVSSLYKLDGVWQAFDYSRTQADYAGVEKAGVPYLWMFAVEDTVYYGRHFYDFKIILNKISDSYVRKILWVHNLSYEFQFILDILKDYTIVDMVCRDTLKPISFTIKELNIQFRCSYMLTNMSLDKASKEYGTVYKKVNQLDYIKSRGETTKLTPQELEYGEYDLLSLHSIICYFRNKYKHLANIPLTATGEVRRDLRDRLDYWYFKNVSWALVPEADMYLRLMATFAGGYTHANMLLSNRVLHDVTSMDIASSYPCCLVTEKYPCRPFMPYTEERYKRLSKRDQYAWVFEIKLTNVKSRYYNHYISYSKIYDFDDKEIVTDNGRIVSGSKMTLWCTDVDLDIIKINYECDVELLQIYGSYKDYLDKRIIRYCLDLYKNKTELKGVSDKVDLYKKSKAYINSLY